MSKLYRLARPMLFRVDPERAHALSIATLKLGLTGSYPVIADDRLRRTVAGISFPNPIGLAAGYDKNAEVPDQVLRLGFGFAEVGTLTPRPQPGNPAPRVFRLTESRALINRLGFNNDGHADALERLADRRRKPGVVGVNIGANKDSENRLADYIEGIHAFAGFADYLTVNISSPNTPGLRDMQTGKPLDRLLRSVAAARDGAAALTARPKVPVFLKVAPDLTLDQIDELAGAVARHGIDGLIVSNTTLARDGVARERRRAEAGGLSGRPLMARSTYVLARFRRAVGKDLPLIGVGGVDSAETALEKIEAGADLVQLYTGLVYGGPSLPARIVRGLLLHMEMAGMKSLREIRDTRTDEICEGTPPPPLV